MQRIQVSGAILVGGRSIRYRSDKTFMSIGSATVAELLVQRLSSVLSDVFFVADRAGKIPGYEDATVVDLQPGLGPLGGLLTALHYAKFDYCFLTACDLPFLNAALVTFLHRVAGDADAVVPVWQDHEEPLAALYHRRCRAPIELALSAGDRSMRSFWMNARVVKVDLAREFNMPDIERMFFNVNTPERYEQMLTMANPT